MSGTKIIQTTRKSSYLNLYHISPKKCCHFLAIGLIWLWKLLEKMLLFFSYWTYMTMEIFRKNVAFFWLLDLYDYGNCWKKCCFFLAIGLIWLWKFFQSMLFFLAIGLIWLWKFLEKNGFFTCNLKTLLCLHFGGSENIILLAC